MAPQINLQQLGHAVGLDLPRYETEGAAGADLRAALQDKDIVLKPGDWQAIPTGLSIELPQNLEAQIRPRSGLAAKFGVTVLNSPGTIDSDYRGEIKVLLINRGHHDFTIKHGDRIAQMVIAKVQQVIFNPVNNLSLSDRGEAGFGSTGVG